MIGIITQNNAILSFFLHLFGQETTQKWQEEVSYEVVLFVDPLPTVLPNVSDPLITIGTTHQENELLHLETPLTPKHIQDKINAFLIQNKQRPSFENKAFLFQGKKRLLIDKETHKIIPLTEKENALLCCLATSFPNALTKEDLLKMVWNYHPDTETHTLESHLYTLRQKMGASSDLFIQNTSSGYILLSDT